MKPHTPDQVIGMKSFVDSQPSVDRKTYTLNGLEVIYTTVDMGNVKPFDYAVAAFVTPRGNSEPITDADYEIAVSNDVPEELQGIWAWHELNDFAVLGHEANDRCLTSENEIASSMTTDPELYQRYLSVRISFYEGLATFIVQDLAQKGNESVYSPADLKGCYDAIEFLKTRQILQKKIAFPTNHVDSPEGVTNKVQDITPRLSLLELAQQKRTELNRIVTQEAIQERERAEQDRIAIQEQAAIQAELKRESDKNANEFIRIMKEHAIPPINFYEEAEIETEGHWEGYGEGKEYHSHVKIDVTHIGEGWIVKPLDPSSYWGKPSGYILLTSGETYACAQPRRQKEEYKLHTFYTKGDGPDIPEDAVSICNDENTLYGGFMKKAEPLEAPYSGQGATLLVDAIIRLEKDKITQAFRDGPEPEPSPTAWVGRPKTR